MAYLRDLFVSRIIQNLPKKWVADNLQTLQAAQVESIIGEYSGYGDEGNWESTSFEPAGAWERLDQELP